MSPDMNPDMNPEEPSVLTAAASTRHAAVVDEVCAWSSDDEDAEEEILEAPQPPGRSGRSLTVALVALLAVAAAACATLLAFGLPPFHHDEVSQETPPTQAVPGAQEQDQGPSPKQGPNKMQTATLCTLYNSVHEAVVANTHMENPDGTDPVGQIAVAANARLALFAGGELLRQAVHDNPDAPQDLRKELGQMASTLQNLAMGYLAGTGNVELDPLRHELDNQIGAVDALCA